MMQMKNAYYEVINLSRSEIFRLPLTALVFEAVRDRRLVSGSPVDTETNIYKNCQTSTNTRML